MPVAIIRIVRNIGPQLLKIGSYIFRQISSVPTKRGENVYSGESSKKELLVHTDNAHTVHPPDWVLLLALRDDPKKEALTSYVRVRDVYKRLTNGHKIELFKNKFQSEVLQSFGGDGKKKLRKPVSILSGSPEEPEIRFNPLMNGMNKNAREALMAMIDQAEKIKKPIHLARPEHFPTRKGSIPYTLLYEKRHLKYSE